MPFRFSARKGVNYWLLTYSLSCLAACLAIYLLVIGNEFGAVPATLTIAVALLVAAIAFKRLRHHERRLAKELTNGSYRPISWIRLHLNVLLLALLLVGLTLLRR